MTHTKNLAISTWLSGAANAQNQYTILATDAEAQLQGDLLGDQAAFTSAVTTAMQTWVTTVSNGIASLWSGATGGGTDVTAVANAWKISDQAIAGSWKGMVDGEAGAFQIYGASEAGARKAAQQAIAAQNVARAAARSSVTTPWSLPL